MRSNLNELSHYQTITTKDGNKMLVNPYDMYIGNQLIYAGEWESHIRKVLKNICEPGMNFIDIGANVGAHTLYMSKLVGETGHGYAFEPCSNHYSVLMYNLIANQCFNTTVLQYGCSDQTETMYIEERFLNTKYTNNFGAITLQSNKKENDEPVHTITVDSLNLPQIDIVKIDAEGMEEKVIKGMKETIKKYRPIFIIEIHKECEETMFELFKSIEYYVVRIHGSWDFIATPNISDRIILHNI
jgi:FkbM family methyltransferase